MKNKLRAMGYISLTEDQVKCLSSNTGVDIVDDKSFQVAAAKAVMDAADSAICLRETWNRDDIENVLDMCEVPVTDHTMDITIDAIKTAFENSEPQFERMYSICEEAVKKDILKRVSQITEQYGVKATAEQGHYVFSDQFISFRILQTANVVDLLYNLKSILLTFDNTVADPYHKKHLNICLTKMYDKLFQEFAAEINYNF